MDGIRGIQLALQYPAVDDGTGILVDSWQACSDWEFPQDDWPQPGAGNTITWVGCETGELVVAGYFRVQAYSGSTLAIIPYGPSNHVKTADCDGAETVIPMDRWGWVGFGNGVYNGAQGGCNPGLEACGPTVSVETTTWGQLTRKF